MALRNLAQVAWRPLTSRPFAEVFQAGHQPARKHVDTQLQLQSCQGTLTQRFQCWRREGEELILWFLREVGVVQRRAVVQKIILPLPPVAPLSPSIHTLRYLFPTLSARTASSGFTAGFRARAFHTASYCPRSFFHGRPTNATANGNGARRGFCSNTGPSSFGAAPQSANGAGCGQTGTMPMGKFVPSVGWNVDTNLNVVADRKEREGEKKEMRASGRVRKNVGKARNAKLGMKTVAKKAEASGTVAEVATGKKGVEVVVAAALSVQQVAGTHVLNRKHVDAAPAEIPHPISVTMFLYAPPTWELTHLAAPMTLLSPLAVADLRRIADAHFKHLTFVATVLEKCLEHVNASSKGGSTSPPEWIQVRELQGGFVEITVVWRRGEREFRDLVQKLGVGEEAYTIEDMLASDEDGAQSGYDVVNTQAAVPDSSSPAHRQEVESFLDFVESLMKEDRSFGGGRSQLS